MREFLSKISMTLLVVLAVLVSVGLPAGLVVLLMMWFSDEAILWVVRLTVTVIGWSLLGLIGFGLIRLLPHAWVRLRRIWASPEMPSDG